MPTQIIKYICDYCEEEFESRCEALEHEEVCGCQWSGKELPTAVAGGCATCE
jgi:hypothetical protein